MRLARRILPDVLLVLGAFTACSGALMISPAVGLLAIGAGLIALAVWMGA